MASTSDLANEIARQLASYTDDVEDKVNQAREKVSNEAVEELKMKSPRKTGQYAGGWGTIQRGNTTIIANKKKPQLTHLLEHGHVKTKGGRVAGKAHIRPVEQKAIEDFTSLVEEAIRQ